MRGTLILILGGVVSATFSGFVSAQQQYSLTPSTEVFTPLIGGTDLNTIEADESISDPIAIGFIFRYFGQDYTELKASSNGFLAFDLASKSGVSHVIGQSATSSKLIAPFWADLSVAEGNASYKLSGVAPNRVFTVEWLNCKWGYVSPSYLSFQVTLYETTDEIKFSYRQEETGYVFYSLSASVGIVGNNPSEFLSLDDTSDNPAFNITGQNSTNEMPGSDQVYTFRPLEESAFAPNVSATNVQANVHPSYAYLSWDNGNGTHRAVFIKETTEAAVFIPTDNQFYPSFGSFGVNSTSAGDGWYCVYNGNNSIALITNLKSGFSYRIIVVEYNGLALGQKYYNPSDDNAITISLPLVRPSLPVSKIIVNSAYDRASLVLKKGSGAFRAVFVRAGSYGLAPALDNATYIPNSVFGAGSQIEKSGWYCVFNGTAITPVNLVVTGLLQDTEYKIHVVDYNGAPGSELYNTDSESAALVFKTYRDLPINYSLHAFNESFIPIVGGTKIYAIHNTDGLASKIPIGFTFYLRGNAFTETAVSSNGFLSFNPHISTVELARINSLTNSFVRPAIAPLWDDLDGTVGEASYSTTGTEPNRIFIVQFLNWQWDYGASVNISFQVRLYEADNRIEFAYRQEAGELGFPSASIGLAFPGMESFVSLSDASISPTTSLTDENVFIDSKPASGQVYAFTPSKLDQTIVFDALAKKPFGSAGFDLKASSDSGLPVTYVSSDPTTASVSGTTITLHKAGQTTITALQEGNTVFNSATAVEQIFSIVNGDQAISFPNIAVKKYGDASFFLDATSDSGLPITYQSSDPAVATINNNQVTIVGVGSATITAKQGGNENYNAAADVQKPLTVEKADQQISFATLPVKILGDNAFTLSASSSAGLPVSFASSNPAIAAINGNTLTIVGYGLTTITAIQSGSQNYNAADPVEQILKVRSYQVITFVDIPTKTLNDPGFTLAPTASSGLKVELSSQSDKITLTNGVVSILSPGIVKIAASQSGDDLFLAAPLIEKTFCINPLKPTITVAGLGSEFPVLQSSATSNNQWFKDDVALAGQTATSLTITGAGIYSVKVIVEGCASEASTPESLIVTDVNTENDQIKVFPNPARDRMTVDVRAWNLLNEIPLAIIDLSGREVLRSAVQKAVDIDIAKLRAGNYQILIKHGSRIISKEFVKH